MQSCNFPAQWIRHNKHNFNLITFSEEGTDVFCYRSCAWLLKQVLWKLCALYPMKHIILWLGCCKVCLTSILSAYRLSQSWSSWSGWAFWVCSWFCVEISYVRQPCWLLAPILTTSSRTKRPAVTCWSQVGSIPSLDTPHMWAGSTGAQERRWESGLPYSFWILFVYIQHD